MKKGWITVSVLLICAMLFGACGKKEAEDQDKLDDLKNKLEQESESSKQGKKPKKKKTLTKTASFFYFCP